LSKAQFGDNSFEFQQRETAANVSAAVAAANIEGVAAFRVNHSVEVLDVAEKNLEGLSEQSKNVARIVTAWVSLEAIVRKRLVDKEVPRAATFSGRQLINAAAVHKLITSEQAKSLLGLNTMRNLAVHGPYDDIDDEKVQEFLVLAEVIRTVLEITAPTEN
jgi:hypothetical protein